MIIALHGFLGLPNDWDGFYDHCPDLRTRSLWNDLRLISPRVQMSLSDSVHNLFAPQSTCAFDLWAEQFTNDVERKFRTSAFRPILMGYSLGGRLAMHALKLRPELFAGGILISSHPGLSSAERGGPRAREERFESDLRWAERFLKQPWQETVDAWNEQAVLGPPPGAKPRLERRSTDFDRGLLADCLNLWSLARQADLRDHQFDCPLLLLSGEFDPKFKNLAAEWAKVLPRAEHVTIAGSGHRVPWDQPQAFATAVQHWVRLHRSTGQEVRPEFVIGTSSDF